MIAIVIPTLNEGKNLKTLIPAIHEAMKGDYTVVIVDDDSRDETEHWFYSNETMYPIQLIVRKGKRGLASAVIDGIASVKADAYIVMDADFSHPPSLLPIIRQGLKRYDLVVASRHVSTGGCDNWPLKRRMISQAAIMLARPLTPIRDTTTGFFGIRAHCLDGVKLTPIGFKIGLEVFVKAYWQTYTELPFTFTDRRDGQSKMGKKQIAEYLKQLAELYKYRISNGRKLS